MNETRIFILRAVTLILAGGLPAASSALAQDADDVGRPSRAVPQTGMTAGGTAR
ncbi:hypothetical protein [Methylobacterium nigriterrae]|uniref:hypothetical protein n=1 Tax=Methylobacterium nigriterrae TaxID=3127512 RepID=UPI003013A6DE